MTYSNDFSEVDLSTSSSDERFLAYKRAMHIRTLEEESIHDSIYDIDIRVLTYLFLCANPDISQGEFARKIGTNPVALSRAINTERFVIKTDWVKGIEELLANHDISNLLKKINTIYDIQKAIIAAKRRECIAQIIAKHYGFKEFDVKTCEGTYWTIRFIPNSIVFTDTETKTEWLFQDFDIDEASFAETFYSTMDFDKSFHQTPTSARRSIVTSDVRSYEILLKSFWDKPQDRTNSKNEPISSIILVDIDNKQLIHESILC